MAVIYLASFCDGYSRGGMFNGMRGNQRKDCLMYFWWHEVINLLIKHTHIGLMTRHWTLSGEVCRILFGRMHFLFFLTPIYWTSFSLHPVSYDCRKKDVLHLRRFSNASTGTQFVTVDRDLELDSSCVNDEWGHAHDAIAPVLGYTASTSSQLASRLWKTYFVSGDGWDVKPELDQSQLGSKIGGLLIYCALVTRVVGVTLA